VTPPSDPVEDMLRRTFTTRAEDMAPGDGAEWSPTDAPAAVAAPDPEAAPAKRDRRAVRRRPGTSRKPLWRPVVVAAMAVAVVVVAVVGVALRGGKNGNDDDGTDIAAVTTSTRPPLEGSGENLSGSSELGGVLDDEDTDAHLFATWHPFTPGEEVVHGDTAEAVTLNPDGGAMSIATVVSDEGDPLIYKRISYEDGHVEGIAVGMTRDEVLATRIERTDPTGVEFTITPPAGFSVVDADPPG
jgi:hypothetical protein